MAPLFDLARLDPCNYDFNNINQVARMQMTIMEFMKLVRSNAFKTPEDRDLISKFCTFVNSDKVVEEWCNVETVVPEFRHALSDQEHDTNLATKATEHEQLNHVLRVLAEAGRLPDYTTHWW
ncbi:hypothetical protein MMC28_002189 [Mycoblastus sanguinarius]|nr:hypothetical protein [Mycoblastus sanguinarius]